MYLGQAAIAVGAPLTLGCRWTLVVSAVALIVLAIRVVLEEGALARTFPEYSLYAAKSKRFVPFLF
jgi:protein-S-isoprenylcysteine O-methyltransferase Ste14